MWSQKLFKIQYLPQSFTKNGPISQKNLNDLGHLSKVTKVKSSSRYSNIFVRFLRVLEYILDIKARYLYSNIRCSAGNIWVFKYISRVPIATRLKTTKLILLDSLLQENIVKNALWLQTWFLTITIAVCQNIPDEDVC